MGYEVDFQAVGEGERSGDAIALRYGSLNGPRAEQTVITIDGGTRECGDKLVKHVRNFYRTNIVDIAFLSHPDTDHASGMRCVLQEMQVKQVAMHLPWNHSTDVHELLDDDRVTPNSIRDRTKRNLAAAREIEALAREKGIEVVEPFAGARNNNGIVVLGPTKEFYQRMLAGFKFMPGVETNEAPMILAKYLKMLGERAVNWIQEHWLKETLLEPADNATKPENNSSVIFMLETEGKKLVFTGDAGVLALESAADFAEANGISLANITFFDVPHHGSRKNLGPKILDRLFGSIRSYDQPNWTAYISAAKDGEPKHPHRKVTNALRRRGGAVYVTAGQNIRLHYNAPVRQGWSILQPIPFYTKVEDDD